MCDQDEEPSGTGCPDECLYCTDNDTTCVFRCDDYDACNARVFDCPDSHNCRVVCNGETSCNSAEVNCPATHGCSVECTAKGACNSLEVNCDGGLCRVRCDQKDACNGAVVNCGLTDTSASCMNMASMPTMMTNAGSNCACDGC